MKPSPARHWGVDAERKPHKFWTGGNAMLTSLLLTTCLLAAEPDKQFEDALQRARARESDKILRELSKVRDLINHRRPTRTSEQLREYKAKEKELQARLDDLKKGGLPRGEDRLILLDDNNKLEVGICGSMPIVDKKTLGYIAVEIFQVIDDNSMLVRQKFKVPRPFGGTGFDEFGMPAMAVMPTAGYVNGMVITDQEKWTHTFLISGTTTYATSTASNTVFVLTKIR